MTVPALSVVIPVYNSARSIPELVAALDGLVIPGGHEIVLVNDGSEDDSLEVCQALLETIRVPTILAPAVVCRSTRSRSDQMS